MRGQGETKRKGKGCLRGKCEVEDTGVKCRGEGWRLRSMSKGTEERK